jgi:hypothetical protein
MEPGADDLDALPSSLYVFVDEDDNTVLAALQEEPGASAPFPMLAVDEQLLPRYVRLAQAYGQREGHRYRLFKFSSCVEVDMAAVPPVRQRPTLRLVAGGMAK